MTDATLIAVTGAAQTAALGYAFGLGLVGVANPCGLPLLPAYLSFFVGSRDALLGRAVRALVASACVTAGFVTCFGVVGLALGGLVAQVESTLPPLMIAAGVSMAILGVLTMIGRHVRLGRLPHGLGVRNRGPLTMVVFGVFYALASLGCSLPVFIAAVGGSLDGNGMWVVFRSCVAYSLGMGLLLAVIALSGATAGASITHLIRAASGRLGQPLAGGLLTVSGAYLAYYWAVSADHPRSTPGLVAAVNRVQADLAGWLTANFKWLGLASGVVVIAILAIAALADNPGSRTHRSGAGDQKEGDERGALPNAADADVRANAPEPVVSPHNSRSSSSDRNHAHR